MNKKVYVIGELNVDMILTGHNVQPEPNKEKMVDDFELTLGSSSAITACRLAQLGLDVFFVSVIGADMLGRYCLERLNDFGVHTEYVTIDSNAKSGVTVSLSSSEDRSLLTYMGTINQVTPKHIPKSLWEEADHLHFGSFYLQEHLKPHWRDIFQKAKSKGITTSFDTGWDPQEQWDRQTIDPFLEYTDLFIPSETEIQHIYGVETLEHIEQYLPSTRGHVLIKEGKNGATHIDSTGAKTHTPAYQVQAIDTTGAGDSFNAGAIVAYLEGKQPNELMTFANACGAISVQHIGGTGGSLQREEVSRFMSAT